jgi:hypothetical protein
VNPKEKTNHPGFFSIAFSKTTGNAFKGTMGIGEKQLWRLSVRFPIACIFQKAARTHPQQNGILWEKDSAYQTTSNLNLTFFQGKERR